jgi:hypothetical protein
MPGEELPRVPVETWVCQQCGHVESVEAGHLLHAVVDVLGGFRPCVVCAGIIWAAVNIGMS